MKYQILIRILFLLLARKKVTANELASRFNISRRTVYRYMDTLSLANIPLIVDYGAQGGFYIASSYKFPSTFFTKEELDRLTNLIDAFNKELGGDNELLDIKDKLLSTSKRGGDMSISSDNLIIDGSGWSDNGLHTAKIQTIIKNIKSNTALFCKYHDRGGDFSERVIEPHALVLKQGIWYVYAYCRLRRGFRLFKVGRIEYLDERDTFTKKEFDKACLPFNKWYCQNEKVELTLKIDKSVLSDVEEWLGVESIAENNGEYFATATLYDDRSLVYEIIKYGGKVKVLSPENIKRKVINSANDLLKLYKD